MTATESSEATTASGTTSEESEVETLRMHESDTGSAPVQIARLTKRIKHLTEHLKINRKDFASRRGLLMMVARRRRLLDYMRRESDESYQQILATLGLRR